MNAPTRMTPQGMGDASLLAAVPGMAGWLGIMTQSARFAADRLQQDMEAQHALLNCRTPQEVVRLHAEYCRTAIEQYSTGMTRLMQAVSEAAAQSARESSTLTSRAYDDIPF